MADYVGFFLNSKASVVQFETIEIDHANFTVPIRIVRNNTDGLVAEGMTFDYYPTRVKEESTKENLDYSLDIDFGDVGTVLAEQLDLIAAVDNFITKPDIFYRLYRSDDLSSSMLEVELEIKKMTFNKEGVSFDITAPMVNTHSTGEKYTIVRFPIIRGLA